MSKLNITDIELEKLLNDMYECRDIPSQVVLDIKNFENFHEALILKKFTKYILNFEHGFDLLVKMVFLINYLEKKSWPKHRPLQFLIFKNNLNPLYSAFDRLVKGFYPDAIILLRTTYEAFIKILFISYFPNDPYITLISKPQKGQIQFNLTNFLKDHLKVDWDFIYAISSSFSHSYNYKVLIEAAKVYKQGQKDIICFELKYDEEMLSIPISFSIFLLWCLIKISMLLFINQKDKKVKPDFYNKLVITEKAFDAIIITMANKWASTFEDVERILKEIKNKEGINIQ